MFRYRQLQSQIAKDDLAEMRTKFGYKIPAEINTQAGQKVWFPDLKKCWQANIHTDSPHSSCLFPEKAEAAACSDKAGSPGGGWAGGSVWTSLVSSRVKGD